jgi:hypothetical protein
VLWLDQKRTVVADPLTEGEGLFASTPVAIADGWKCAVDLRPGDLIVTFDDGLQPVRSIRSQPQKTSDDAGAILLPRLALGNVQPVFLMPEQTVMIEADLAEELYGEPFVTVPAAALHGWAGALRAPAPAEPSFQLLFDTAQLVYVAGDMLVGCPGQPSIQTVLGHSGTVAIPLGPAAARHLVACLIAEEAGEGLRRALVGKR